MSARLLIVIATYNEAGSLPTLVDDLRRIFPAASILVIDDNSPDGTGHWCEEAAKRLPHFQVIHRPGKLGLGTATIQGLNWGLAQSFDYIATLDADMSHDPVTLAAMFETLSTDAEQEFHVIIGSRYVAGGAIYGWPWYRRLASYTVNQYARIVLRLPTRDNTSAMRIYRSSLLREVELERLRSPGYAYLEEILVLLSRSGGRFIEYPIVFKNRERGRSKVSPVEIAGSLWQILKLSFTSLRS